MILDCVDARETPDFKEEYKLPVGAEVGLRGKQLFSFFSKSVAMIQI